MSDYKILIGACGWLHEKWNTSYYPEELPPEWRLAYYGNEYPVVLIPAGYWPTQREAIAQACEEIDERPCFVCEWSLPDLVNRKPEFDTALELLGKHVEVVLLRLEALPSTTEYEAIRQLAATRDVCLDWPQADDGKIQQLLAQFGQDYMPSVCWRGDEADRTRLNTGPVALARVNTSGQSPRSLRAILEALLASAGQRQALLLFEGEPPETEIMDQAEVIMNLL